MEAIRIENLSKYYGKARGIEQISLSVAEGEFFGFIGPNGAGKSTTIRTLLGLVSPTGGHAAVLGFDIVKEKEKILARTGYLPSEAMFHSGMRVRDVLKLSADLRKKDCRDVAAGLCERLQLDTGRKVDELSFGKRKKVAIVCALQHEPQLLILDEPTSGLDPLMQKAFFEILRERNRFYLYNPFFDGDTRVNLIQVWDYHEDDSMTFHLLYTFEKDNRIFQKEKFEEHYIPVRRELLLHKLRELRYEDIKIMDFPACVQREDVDEADWYCVIARKGE